MKHLMIGAALFACACAPPAPPASAPEQEMSRDGAGNRLEALAGAERACTQDAAWCVVTDPAGTRVLFNANGAEREIATFASVEGEQRETWPFIVRQPGTEGGESVLIGLQRTEHQMYSGGGASVTFVTLYALSSGTAIGALAAPVLTAPTSASVTIRACFSEADVAARRDACADEYNFAGEFSLDTENSIGPPRLVLTTVATSYPGRRSRTSDSTTEPPLEAADLVAVRDESCSYRRVASFDTTVNAYVFEQALPPCTDYLEP